MAYEIEFEDQGQDLLSLTVNSETGEITDAQPFHFDLYVGQGNVVDVKQLHTNRMVHFTKNGDEDTYFKWPMIKLSISGHLLMEDL